MRKAQISGQVFVYIMAIIIAGLVLMFGVNVIKGQLANQDKIVYSKFVEGVKNTVSTTRFNSVDQEKYKLSLDYVEVCFVDYTKDMNQINSKDSANWLETNHPFIADEIANRPVTTNEDLLESNTNMFLVDKDGGISAESVGKVKYEDGGSSYYFCTQVKNGYVELQFQGIKGGVKITEWEE